MKIACLQLNANDNVDHNVKTALGLIAQAAGNGADVVVLPEMFTFMGSDAGRIASADPLNGGVFAMLGEAARKHHVVLIGGSHAERSSRAERVYNTCLNLDAQGNTLAVYRKIHLFNLRTPTGEPLFCESDVYVPGTDVTPFSFEHQGEKWNALTAICYDLRFPEIFRTLTARKTPYDVIFLPAAFTHQTGEAHWELLVRARAVENQCYVVACNQTGTFAEGSKRNYGHSLVVDPWGKVVAKLGEETGILMADINQASIREARTRLPALQNRML